MSSERTSSETRKSVRRPSKSFKTNSGNVRTPTRSVEHTLDVLELLAGSGEAVGVTEVAHKLGLSAPGAHRLLATLRDRGYAEQDAHTSRYSIGLRAFGLGALSAGRQDLRTRAAPHARTLMETTDETVHVALYDRGWIVYLDRIESGQPVAPVTRIGVRSPAHCVATGRAVLAYLPRTEVDAIVERGLEAYADSSPTTRAEIDEVLTETRERGWARNDGSFRVGVAGIAAPIRDWSGQVVASIGCCLPSSRLTADSQPTIVEAVMVAAARVSAGLGFVFHPAGDAPSSD